MIGWCAFGLIRTSAEQFELSGTTFDLRDVTADVSVTFRSLRLNRAVNQWNYEVVVSNRTSQVLVGPLVLAIESFRGTSGPLQADGRSVGPEKKPSYELRPEADLGPGESTSARTLLLGVGTGVPVLTTRVYAAGGVPSLPLAVTRTLDGSGQPLPGVSLLVTGSAGTTTRVSDARSGVVSLPGEPGEALATFSLEGYLSVTRRFQRSTAEVTVIPNPRLTRRSDRRFPVTPLGGTVVTNEAGTVQIRVDPGAFSSATDLRLTPVDGQSLPGLLPLGWSPLSAFWWEPGLPPARALSAIVQPGDTVAPDELAAWVRWNESGRSWEVLETLPGQGAHGLSVSLGVGGVYALIAADRDRLAPPAPVAGSPLLGSAARQPSVTGLTASGVVDPVSSPASRVPSRVTGQATVTLRHDTEALPSGTLVRGDVTEAYRLADQSRRVTPMYEQHLVAYQRPGDDDLQTAQAQFPMQPLLLFGAEELDEATVRMDILPTVSSRGVVLDERGGLLRVQGLRLVVGAGQLAGPTAFQIQGFDVSHLTNGLPGSPVAWTGFELTFDAGQLSGAIQLQSTEAPPGSQFVLARVVDNGGVYGLEPVERLASDGSGRLRSVEPGTSPRLPGISGSGQYALVPVSTPQALVRGEVRGDGGAVRPGLPVRIEGSPWLSITDLRGAYTLIAPVGAARLSVVDPVTGNEGNAAVDLEVAGRTVDLTVAIRGPRVVNVSPAPGASNVPPVLSVVVQLSKPINPGTLGAGGIELVDEQGRAVPAAVTLNLQNTTATLNPNAGLNLKTVYRVRVSPSLTDLAGLPLEGDREFTFTTQRPSTRDPAAQLIIYEPGATNIPPAVLAGIPAFTPGLDRNAIVVQGTLGVADPEVPVVLVNESTGETSTVLSKPDGSFNSLISGASEDFVSATFVNLNGTRVYVPVSRQQFDNGFVGLYRQGGILEAESDGGPVRVYIQPEAVVTKTKFRLKPLTAGELSQALEGVQPAGGKVAGNALRVEIQGGDLQQPVQLRTSVNLLSLGFPTNAEPTQAAVALTRIREEDGVKTFEVLDQLTFTPRESVAANRSARPAGLLDNEKFLGFLDTASGFVPGAFGDFGQPVFQFIVVPMLLGGRSIVIRGRALEAPLLPVGGNPAGEALVQLTADTFRSRPLRGAFVILRALPYVTIGPAGRLEPGMIHATSDQDGKYVIVAPTFDIPYILTAEHPRFEERVNEPVLALLDLGLAGTVKKDFIFRTPKAELWPPRLTIAHGPLYPAVGEACTVQISATQGSAAAPKVSVRVKSVRQLVTGDNLPLEGFPLTDVKEDVFDGNRRRWMGKLNSTQPALVVLLVAAQGQNGIGQPPVEYRILFSGSPPPNPDDPIPTSDPTEKRGPQIVATIPAEQGYAASNGEITLVFNEPIAREVEKNPGEIQLAGASQEARPVVSLSADQRTLRLIFPGLTPDTAYTLNVPSGSIRDLNGNALDQRPSTKEADGLTLNFRSAPIQETALAGITRGRGAALSGRYLYVIDAGDRNALVTYDVENPQRPLEISRVQLFGPPRDLVVIPNYSYRLNGHNLQVYTGDVVAVVGGTLDTIIDKLDSVIVKGQYLTVFDMANPGNPRQLASPVISRRVGSAVVKVKWNPPYLVYQDFSAELNQIVGVDLQALIIGYNTDAVRQDVFPKDGRDGVDRNGDGDFVDEGEILPFPERRPTTFFGRKFAQVLDRTTQKILDFSMVGGVLGVTLTRGQDFDNQGHPSGPTFSPQYRTLRFNGSEPDRAAGSWTFNSIAYPKRVTLVEGFPVELDGRIATPLVAIVSLTPDQDGQQKLVFLDITLPESVKKIGEVPIPESLIGGFLQSVEFRADGLLEVYSSRNAIALQPLWVARPAPGAGVLHPAILGTIPNAGAGTRSVATSAYGLRAVAEDARNTILQTAPRLQFVFFPDEARLVDAEDWQSRPTDFVAPALARMRAIGQLVPARREATAEAPSDLKPPQPLRHYYVSMDAPGGAGPVIPIVLEALNPAGWPLPNRGPGFPPVRSMSAAALDAIGQTPRPGCDAPIQTLQAYRLSNDPSSPLYNKYLSRPIALLAAETVQPEDLAELRANPKREILFSGAYLRASLDPANAANNVLGAYAAVVDTDSKRLKAPAFVTATTLNVGYVTGDSPPPLGGTTRMPRTQGAVVGHSGEVRTSATDMSLPSRRMPIQVTRSIGAQDAYDGPFGLGWDFNFGQRITELDPGLFPEGLRLPLVPRDTPKDSTVGASHDVLFHSGEGRVVLFIWKGTNLPPEYAADPLVREFGYAGRVSDYFLPEPGIFDLLVKFRDGRYERVTPSGERYRYAAGGRLEEVIDTYPDSRHVLEYDQNGWLVRIDDTSVSVDRYLRFGYYRRRSDPAYNGELDLEAPNGFVEGKICRLRDFGGADVLYFYDGNGLLVRREGVEVAGENGGFKGRSQTHYLYKECRFMGVTVGEAGAPVFVADAPANARRQPVAKGGDGVNGKIQLSVPPDTTAAKLKGLKTSTTLGKGATRTTTYDSRGFPKSVEITGTNGPPAKIDYTYNEHGQPLTATYVRGRVETITYDSANPIFRSRANMLSLTVNPGPKGGEGYTVNYAYDPRYNLTSGPQTTPNGSTMQVKLTSDGRDVSEVSYGDGLTLSSAYNEYGQTLRVEDYDGVVVTTDYDTATGYVVRTSTGENQLSYTYGVGYAGKMGLVATLRPAVGTPSQFQYDQNLQVVEMRRGALLSQSTYNEHGRPVRTRQLVGDGRELVETTEYDTRGFVTHTVANGVEVGTAVAPIEHVFTPDTEGRLHTALPPGGPVQTYEYDDRGNLASLTTGARVEEYAYDEHNNRTETKVNGKVLTKVERDGLDRVAKTQSFTGDSVREEVFSYHPAGELKSYVLSDSKYGVLKEQNYSLIDPIGRPKDVTLMGGVISPRYQYSYGPLKSTVVEPRQTTVTEWNQGGQSVLSRNPIAELVLTSKANGLLERAESKEQGASYIQTYEYDDLDNQVASRDALGLMQSFRHRADGALQEVANARGNKTVFENTVLGEPLSEKRSDGLEFQHRRDAQRRLQFTGDPGSGTRYVYDDQLRLTQMILRNGSAINYGDFDGQNMPRQANMPGGEMTMAYDQFGQLLQQRVNYRGTVREIRFDFDALTRVRDERYHQGGSENRGLFEFDKSGVLVSARRIEDGLDTTVRHGYYGDGTHRSVAYPSGPVVNEVRDDTGRLTGVTQGGTNIAQVETWQGNAQPRRIRMGSDLEINHTYDVRGRLVATRVTRSSDGHVMAHLRYRHDAADNLVARQYLHRSGKTDTFAFDNGERLQRAGFGILPTNTAGDGSADFSRAYSYHAGGLDYLLAVTNTVAGAFPVPPFADRWSGHDAFLQPSVVAGYNRGEADPMGNVQRAMLWTRESLGAVPVPVEAELRHDGLGNLVEVSLANGVVVEYGYQPSGLRFSKKVRRGDAVLDHRQYVYDSSTRLIEEYLRQGTNTFLQSRYYYGDGDAPLAADFVDPASGGLNRHYFIRDGAMSVVAVADDSGRVVERVWYDAFGQPVLEGRDERSPRLAQLIQGDNDSLILVMSEPVLPPLADPGLGVGIVPVPVPVLSEAVRVEIGGERIAGTIDLARDLTNYPPNTVLRFKPERALPDLPSPVAAWWPGDTEVVDVIGGLKGTLKSGAVMGPGRIQQGFRLNGTGAYVEVPDSPSLRFGAGDFTATVWVNLQRTNADQALLDKLAGPLARGWSLQFGQDRRLSWRVNQGASAGLVISQPLAVGTNEWLQVAVRRQAGRVTLFTNGVPVIAGDAAIDADSDAPLRFGSSQGTGAFLNGTLDEVVLYSRALSDDELRAAAVGVAAAGGLHVQLAAGVLADEWGNLNESADLAVTPLDQEGTVYYSNQERTSGSLARSRLDNPFLFHGQYFDYETGLLYLRARYFDPYAGMFLEPDPLGYADSVNLYAAMGNNPVNFRDASGLSITGTSALARGAESFLSKEGLTALEIEAISFVLKNRSESITLSIRRFVKYESKSGWAIKDVDTAAWRRMWAEESTTLKGVASKAKNSVEAEGTQTMTRFVEVEANRFDFGGGKIYHAEDYSHAVTSDLDALHVEINGQFASVDQIRDLFKEINHKFIELHKAKHLHLGELRPRPNPPFQHEGHAHLLHQVGNRLGKQATSDGLGFVTLKDIGKIGHPADAFVITSTKSAGGAVIDARGLKRREIGEILDRGLQDFLGKRDSLIGTKLFHRDGRRRLNLDGTPVSLRDLRKAGYFDIKSWPTSFNYFKDGTAGLPGVR